MNHIVYYCAGELKVKEKYVYNSLYIVYMNLLFIHFFIEIIT